MVPSIGMVPSICLTGCFNIHNELTMTVCIWQKPAVTSYCFLNIPPALIKECTQSGPGLGCKRVPTAATACMFNTYVPGVTLDLCNNLRWFWIYRMFNSLRCLDNLKQLQWHKVHTEWERQQVTVPTHLPSLYIRGVQSLAPGLNVASRKMLIGLWLLWWMYDRWPTGQHIAIFLFFLWLQLQINLVNDI